MRKLLMVLGVIEKVKDEYFRLLELNVLVHFHRLRLEMRVDGFPETTKAFTAAINVICLPPDRNSFAAIIGGLSASALPSFSMILVAACRTKSMKSKEWLV